MSNPAYEGKTVAPSMDTKPEHQTDIENNQVVSNKKELFAIVKNVVIISFSFMILFASYQCIGNLQSSLNKDENLGMVSLSVVYASLIISSMFLPSYILKKTGEKWGMVFAMICYAPYIAVQFYPRMYTLVPAAIFRGFGAAPLWTFKCTYITKMGNKYAELTQTIAECHIVRFFSIFFFFLQFASLLGNLVSSLALSIGREVDTNTTVISDDILSICGTNYCPTNTKTVETLNATAVEENFRKTNTQTYTLAGIFLVCTIISPIIIAFLVDPLSRFFGETQSREEDQPTGLGHLFATFYHIKNKRQLLIIPITIWSGLEQGFFEADFTAAYITCSWGIHNVGYVLITYGVCNAIFTMTFGGVIKKIGRLHIFIFGAGLNIIVIIVLFSWMPNPNQSYVLFIMAALWGISDAVWQTQINALYGVIFTAEESRAAFSNYLLWESLGFIFAYILQTQVCVYAKLWVLIGTLALGMVGYLTVEVMEKRKGTEKK